MNTSFNFIFKNLVYRFLFSWIIIMICSIVWAIDIKFSNEILGWLIDSLSSNQSLIFKYFGIYFGFKLIHLVFMRIYDYVWLYLRVNLRVNIVKEIYFLILKTKGLDFNSSFNSIKDLSENLVSLLNMIFNSFTAYVFMLTFAFYSFFMFDIKMFYLFCCLLITFCIGITIVIKQGFNLTKHSTQSKINVFNYILNIGSNLFYVHFYQNYEYEKQQFNEKLNVWSKASLKRDYLYFLLHFVQTIICFAYEFFCLYILLHLFWGEKIKVGTVVSYYSYNKLLMKNIWDLTFDISRFLRIYQQVNVLLSQVLSKKLQIPSSKKHPKNFEIEFKNVNFKYLEDGEYKLKDFSLKIKQGEKVAIVGSSGIGKTTLINLLLKVFVPESGQILIGNEDINSLDIQNYITIVSQNLILFNRSVYDNIRYSNLNATEIDVHKAAALAEIHDEIVNKIGYNYEINEKNSLSFGQKQRILLARMFLSSSSIIVLDEPTSSIDMGTEKKINQNIVDFANTHNKTLIIVTHRTEIIKDMDQKIDLTEILV